MQIGNRAHLAAQREAFEAHADNFIFSEEVSQRTRQRTAHRITRSAWDDIYVVTRILPFARVTRYGVIVA